MIADLIFAALVTLTAATGAAAAEWLHRRVRYHRRPTAPPLHPRQGDELMELLTTMARLAAIIIVLTAACAAILYGLMRLSELEYDDAQPEPYGGEALQNAATWVERGDSRLLTTTDAENTGDGAR